MKITQKHFAVLRTAIEAVLSQHPDIRAQYAKAGFSNMRLNWDLLRAARIEGKPGMVWACDVLYQYANDRHISTALRAIVGNDGKDSKGRI